MTLIATNSYRRLTRMPTFWAKALFCLVLTGSSFGIKSATTQSPETGFALLMYRWCIMFGPNNSQISKMWEGQGYSRLEGDDAAYFLPDGNGDVYLTESNFRKYVLSSSSDGECSVFAFEPNLQELEAGFRDMLLGPGERKNRGLSLNVSEKQLSDGGKVVSIAATPPGVGKPGIEFRFGAKTGKFGPEAKLSTRILRDNAPK